MECSALIEELRAPHSSLCRWASQTCLTTCLTTGGRFRLASPLGRVRPAERHYARGLELGWPAAHGHRTADEPATRLSRQHHRLPTLRDVKARRCRHVRPRQHLDPSPHGRDGVAACARPTVTAAAPLPRREKLRGRGTWTHDDYFLPCILHLTLLPRDYYLLPSSYLAALHECITLVISARRMNSND